MLCFYKTVDNIMTRMDTFSEGCWINVVGPTPEEIAYLTEELHLDRGFVSAALDEEESSRVEVEDDQTLIIIDTPLAVTEAENTLVYTTMPLGIIVTKSNVVTVCLNEITAVNDIASGVVRNVQTAMKTRFLLTLLLRVAQSFLIRLKHINKLTSQMETELHHSMQNKQLVQMMGLQKSLVYFSTSLKANEITLEKIYRGRVIKLYEEDQDLLEDVLIEFKQAVEMSGTYSSILQETMDAFSSIISNNMNQVMKTLTIVTVLMEIPTMIFSFYGMNMQDLNRFIPFTGFALSLSIGIVGLVAFIFWRKKY
ncbi:MAG: magnesium transporter CorA family protein [Oscillospiraceae bacterium]|nr:magnesium transporter CorA family protein [Oscillospiraceae bacterium]MDY3064956.1 magnesium transporter CorA family protein [Oscillospiraceae bacterium]